MFDFNNWPLLNFQGKMLKSTYTIDDTDNFDKSNIYRFINKTLSTFSVFSLFIRPAFAFKS